MSEISPGGSEATVSAGPTTFAEAFAADVSPASEPTDSADASATAAAQPEQTGADNSQTSPETTGERSPFIPRARFDEVNTKLNELKTWKEQRAWADGVDGAQFDQMRQWYARAATDTQGFAINLLDELLNSPVHAQGIRSELARRLGTRPQRAETPADGMPDADVAITDANGNVVGKTYSAEKLAQRDAYLERQFMAKVEQQFGPKLKTLDDVQAERQQMQAQHAAQEFGKSFHQELSALPLFEEHKQAIGQTLKGMQLTSDHPAEVKAAAYQAYYRVVGPKLKNGGQTKQDVMADLQRKAAASTSVNPSAASSAAPRSPSSFFDKDLKW
jgi:hypothetical protein